MSRSYLGAGWGQCQGGNTQDPGTSMGTAPEAGGTGHAELLTGQRETRQGVMSGEPGQACRGKSRGLPGCWRFCSLFQGLVGSGESKGHSSVCFQKIP